MSENRGVKIAPSLLSADFCRLGEEVRLLTEAGADYLHLDIMDGHFVPNITIGPMVVRAIRKCTTLPLDVHLMIEAPERYIKEFVDAGADIISVHVEVCTHLNRTLQLIRELGVKPAVALNPTTPLSTLDHILEDVEMILIMTVNPGFEGQDFIKGMLPKIGLLRRRLDNEGLKVELEVDGGINLNNIADVFEAGANVFVSGSGILKTDDYRETISNMKAAIMERLATEGFGRSI